MAAVGKENKTTLFLFRYSNLQALHDALLSFISQSGSTNLFHLPVHIVQNDPFFKGGLLIIANKKEELIVKLNNIIDKIIAKQPIRFPLAQKIHHAADAGRPGKIAFLFPGFGSEHPAMLTGLENKFPIMEKWLSMARSILEVPDHTTSVQLEEIAKKRFSIKESALMQKGSLGIISSLAYHAILGQLHIPCDGMIGHSNGENAALIASGIVQFKNDEEMSASIKKIIGIPALMDNKHEGQYLVINNYSAEKLDKFLKKYDGQVFLAMKNCPNQMVVYVIAEKFEEVRNRLSVERAMAIPLYTDHPYHTPLYAKQAETIRGLYLDFILSRGTAPLYSCVDAAPFYGDRGMITDKAVSQWTETVDFENTINTLYDDGFRIFIEVGPNNKLTNFVKDTLKNKSCTVISSNLPDKNNIDILAELACILWINGIDVNLDIFNTKTGIPKHFDVVTDIRKAPVNKQETTLVFKKYQELMQDFLQVQERSWQMFKEEVENRQKQTGKAQKFIQSEFPLLAEPVATSCGKMYIEKHYDLDNYPFFKDHALGKKLAVIPFTVSLEIVAEAASLFSGGHFTVTNIKNASGHSWLALENGKLDVGVEAAETGFEGSKKKISVILYEIDKPSNARKKAFEATVLLSAHHESQNTYEPVNHTTTNIDLKPAIDFYKEDLFHGPYFTGITKVVNLDGEFLTATMQMPVLKGAFTSTAQPIFQIPGALLDCSGQLAAYWLMSNDVKDFAVFPFSLENYAQFAPFPPEGSPLKCDAKITRMQTVIEAEFSYYDNQNKLLAQLKGFKMILYQHKLIPAILMDRLQPADLENTLTLEFLQEAGGIWNRTLAVALLNTDDYRDWLSLTTIENKIHYIMDHIQNKYSTH